MKALKQYTTAAAFRKALEDRLLKIARKEEIDLQRIRRQVTFDRFLARLFTSAKAPWALKGGYAVELRIKEARATKDIDLTVREALSKGKGQTVNQSILTTIQEAASNDLGDFFVFLVGESIRDLDAAPYGGARYPVDARLDGRNFAKFHLDIGIGDIILYPLEMTESRDWLNFAGIPGARFPTISKEQQFAEKLHAYTLPRNVPNSRVRDIIDMLLLTKTDKMDLSLVRKALRATFERRKTHSLPVKLEPPPQGWEKSYTALAHECKLSEGLGEAFEKLKNYFAALVL